MKISSTPFRAALLTLTISPFASAAVLTTVTTSGYTRDIVYEAGLAADTTNAITHAFGSRAFFEGGAYGTGNGIKRTGNTGRAGYSTTSGNTVNFDFQAFNGNNALSVGSGGATLGLSGSSDFYSTLGFVAASSSVSVTTFSYTVQYAQGANTTGTFTVGNWGSNPTGLTSNIFIEADGRSQTTRMTTGTPPVTATSAPSDRFDQTMNGGGTWNVYLYEATVDASREITNITFSSSTAGDHVIFGVVGAIPEPTSSALFAGALGLGLLRRKRQGAN